MEQDIKKLYTSFNSTPFRTSWTKFETYNPMDVGEDRLQMKTGVLWDMSTDKMRGTEPTDTKLAFSERKFKDLSENVYFYPHLMYSC